MDNFKKLLDNLKNEARFCEAIDEREKWGYCSVCSSKKSKSQVRGKVSGDGSRVYTICSSCESEENRELFTNNLLILGGFLLFLWWIK